MLHQCTQCDYNSKVKCNVKRHMKVHVKRNEVHPTTKRKHDEDNTHEEDQPMIKKKWYVLNDDELEKRIYKILYDVKVFFFFFFLKTFSHFTIKIKRKRIL